ncbi:hypothetical protein FS837_005105 [Tulasnella sp. UAMH 9824]|nr:hypothetical protein FS837_005105 [Tulasnella sp. UAMH 9824]
MHQPLFTKISSYSEEDNNDTLEDARPQPQTRITLVHGRPAPGSPLGPNSNEKPSLSSTRGFGPPIPPRRESRSPSAPKNHGAAILLLDSEDFDSPTYDGDVESSTAATPLPSTRSFHNHQSHLSVSTLADDSVDDGPSIVLSSTTPTRAQPSETTVKKGEMELTSGGESHFTRTNKQHLSCALAPGEPTPAHISEDVLDPALFTPQGIRAHVNAAIEGTLQPHRAYRPSQPPVGRPVRVYADGVYDIFHFGHALQLRQAKLSFESVHLLVGICSDELCSEHKSRTVMAHSERCESVRHCRWVDEIVPEAPWVIDQAFIDKYKIDYVAHDDDPYKGSDGSDDVYQYVKSIGRFIPTRRTPGVSTSELLERIVAGYREGDWDAKLVKIGHPELASRAPSRAASRPQSRLDSKTIASAPLSPAGPLDASGIDAAQ